MEIQFTRQAENALKLAKTTARSCGHSYIGTEHLLLGILSETEGTAGRVMEEFKVDGKKLVELQRALARVRNVVMDGRDICSYVLPDATHKFFVTAEPEVRAARRYAEYEAAGKLNGRNFDDILCEIKRRDERDSTREAAPLRPADDAVVIDTSEMNVESAVAAVLAHIG